MNRHKRRAAAAAERQRARRLSAPAGSLSGPQTICLALIVKNENGPHLRRCIESVRPFITAWAVVDTGSTDGTQEALRSYLADVPGELIERDWVDDFACSRNQALELAGKSGAEFAMVLDADDYVVPRDGDSRPLAAFTTDVVSMPGIDCGKQLLLATFIRLGAGLRFRGRVHEVVVREDGSFPMGVCEPSYSTCRTRDGSASADDQAKQAYYRSLLLRSVDEDPRDFFAWEALARDALALGKGVAARGYLEEALKHLPASDVHRQYVARLSRISTFQPFADHGAEILAEVKALIRLCPERAEAPRWFAWVLRMLGQNARAEQFDVLADTKTMLAGAFGIDYGCYRPPSQRTATVQYIIVPPPVQITETCSHSFADCVTHVVDNEPFFSKPASHIRAAQRILTAVELSSAAHPVVALKDEDYEALKVAFEKAENGFGAFKYTEVDNETKAVVAERFFAPPARKFLAFIDAVANATTEPPVLAWPTEESAPDA